MASKKKAPKTDKRIKLFLGTQSLFEDVDSEVTVTDSPSNDAGLARKTVRKKKSADRWARVKAERKAGREAGREGNEGGSSNGDIGAGIGMAANLITSVSKNEKANNYISKIGAGAAAGMSIGGPWGAAVGAAVGTVSAAISAHQLRKEEAKKREKAILEANTQISNIKQETTDVFSTKESAYNSARIEGDYIVGLPDVGKVKFMAHGGKVKKVEPSFVKKVEPGFIERTKKKATDFMAKNKADYERVNPKTGMSQKDVVKMITGYAEGGKVKGAGGPKDDAIDTSLQEGSVVVPAENADKAAMLRKQIFGESPQKKMKGGGKIPVSLSNGEHVFTPKEKATIDIAVAAQGGNPKAMWDKLIPNPDKGNELKHGGTAKADTTGTGLVAKDKVVGTVTPTFTKQQLADIEDAKKIMWKRRTSLPKTQQPILMADGGEAGDGGDGGDDVAALLKALDEQDKKSSEAFKRRSAVNKKAEEIHNKSKKDKEDDFIRKGWNPSSQSLIKAKSRLIEKAKLRIKQGKPDEAKTLLKEALSKNEKIEASLDPQNYKRSVTGAFFSPELHEENKKKAKATPVANVKAKVNPVAQAVATQSNPNSPLLPDANAATQAAVNAAASKKASGQGGGKGKGTKTPAQTMGDKLGLADIPLMPSRKDAVVPEPEIAKPKTPALTTEKTVPEKPPGFMDNVSATDILSIGQVMAGMMTANKERPLDTPNPIFVSRVASAIAASEKAKDEAQYGFGYKENKAIDSALEQSRLQAMRDAVQISGGSGPTIGMLRTISQDKNKAILEKAVQDENVKRGKQQVAVQTSAQADEMSARLDARGRDIFADDKEAYYAEAEAAGNLMRAGLTNFFNSQDQKKIEAEKAKREKKDKIDITSWLK